MCTINWLHWIFGTFIFGKITQVIIRCRFYSKMIFCKFRKIYCRLEVRLIYVLIRPKRTESCADRLEKILSQPIFTELLQLRPNLRSRIRILYGVLTELNLGILESNVLSDVIASTEIVVHSAANVSFDATVFEAIETNLCGTYQLLQLCKQIPQLTSFLYVSTAFCQIHHDEPVEQFYEPVIDPMLLIKCFQRFGGNSTNANEQNAFETIMMKLMSETKMIPYTLSKNVAEALVQSFADQLPIAVIRPSIGEFVSSVVETRIHYFSFFLSLSLYLSLGCSCLYITRPNTRLGAWLSTYKSDWRGYNEWSRSHTAFEKYQIECGVRRYGN